MRANNGSLQRYHPVVTRVMRFEGCLVAFTRKDIVGVPVQAQWRFWALDLIYVDTERALPSLVLNRDEELDVDVCTFAINILGFN